MEKLEDRESEEKEVYTLKLLGLNCHTWPRSNNDKLKRLHNMLEERKPDILVVLETGSNAGDSIRVPHDNYEVKL